MAEQYGVDPTKFPGGDQEAYCAFLQRGIDTYAFSPQLSLRVEVETMLERLLSQLAQPLPSEAGEPEDSALELLAANHPDEHLALLAELNQYLTQQNGYRRFRASYLEADEQGQLVELFYPAGCRDLLQRNQEPFKRRGYLKFNQLNNFINNIERLAELKKQDALRRRTRPPQKTFL